MAVELIAVDAALLTGASWGDVVDSGPVAPAARRAAASTAAAARDASAGLRAPASLGDTLDSSRDGLNLMLKVGA